MYTLKDTLICPGAVSGMTAQHGERSLIVPKNVYMNSDSYEYYKVSSSTLQTQWVQSTTYADKQNQR